MLQSQSEGEKETAAEEGERGAGEEEEFRGENWPEETKGDRVSFNNVALCGLFVHYLLKCT